MNTALWYVIPVSPTLFFVKNDAYNIEPYPFPSQEKAVQYADEQNFNDDEEY